MHNSFLNLIYKNFSFSVLILISLIDIVYKIFGVESFLNNAFYIILVICIVIEQNIRIMDELKKTQEMLKTLNDSKTKSRKTKKEQNATTN